MSDTTRGAGFDDSAASEDDDLLAASEDDDLLADDDLTDEEDDPDFEDGNLGGDPDLNPGSTATGSGTGRN